MSFDGYRVKPYAHKRLKWQVRGKENGKWVRKYFETKAEAETYAQIKNTALRNEGFEGAAFPSSLRVMALREQKRLEPHGKTLTDAVSFYLKHLEAVSRSVSLEQALAELIENRKANGTTKQYCADLHWRINRFIRAFPKRTAAEITTRDIDDWLAGLKLAPVTRNTFRRDLRTLFSFCCTRHYCPDNPAIQSSRAKEIETEIGILSVAEVTRILTAASEETLPFWAIGAFAGLRRAEILRLDWSEIDFESGLIEVKANKAKTARRRLVTILPNLKAWLAPYAGRFGPVCPNNLRKRLIEDRERAKLQRGWPNNALRHSFGSYHLAHFKDAPALALQMGNSPDMIFRHYRELVKPKDAERYWAIQPAATNTELVAFSA